MIRKDILITPFLINITRLVRRIIRPIDPYGRVSYGQEGEDILLERFFGDQKQGFYVDVGAHHPLRFSNTYLLYQHGWSGINIDAMPGSMTAFRRLRPRDINIESGVALMEDQLEYYIFKEKALNTFDESLVKQYVIAGHEVSSRLLIRTCPLAKLLNEHLPIGRRIDLLSVDVEGYDLDALRSNDWQKFRPRVVVVEELRTTLCDRNTTVSEFLIKNDYHEFARTYNSVFYVANEEDI